MTYKQLANKISEMNESQLNSDLTILEGTDEYYPARLFFAKEETCDVLDHNHPYIAR